MLNILTEVLVAILYAQGTDGFWLIFYLMSKVADGLTIEAILNNWLHLKPIIMKEWNEDRDALIDLFGRVRDDWIQNDLSGWIGANRYCN